MSPTTEAKSLEANSPTRDCRNVWKVGTVLAIGFSLGLLVGVGMLIGSWMTVAARSPRDGIPELPLQATATAVGETFSIATGPITDGVEGIFTLDFLTGELQCWVLNCRTNQIAGYFRHNVIADLGMDQTRKNPQYLMVTGETGSVGGGNAVRYSDCILYVADATSGNIVGYAIPWNRTIAARQAQGGAMLPIFKQAARNLELRGQ